MACTLAQRFVEVFAGFDAVVAPSGSCVAHLRTHVPAHADDPDGVATRTFELSEFLVDRLGVTDVGSRFEGSVTYHPTCHSLRTLRLGDRPESLLRAVTGVELRPLADATECCGFGGTFAVKYPEISDVMVGDKTRAIAETGAALVLAGDLGCLMNMAGKASREGRAFRARHVVEVLVGDLGTPAIGDPE